MKSTVEKLADEVSKLLRHGEEYHEAVNHVCRAHNISPPPYSEIGRELGARKRRKIQAQKSRKRKPGPKQFSLFPIPKSGKHKGFTDEQWAEMQEGARQAALERRDHLIRDL